MESASGASQAQSICLVSEGECAWPCQGLSSIARPGPSCPAWGQEHVPSHHLGHQWRGEDGMAPGLSCISSLCPCLDLWFL